MGQSRQELQLVVSRPYSRAEIDACIPALLACCAQLNLPNLIQFRVPLLGDGATHNSLGLPISSVEIPHRPIQGRHSLAKTLLL